MLASRTLGVLRHPAFRGLWLATVISSMGAQIQAVGAAWLMTTLTPSQGMVSLVHSATTLPIMAGVIFAGVLADSFDRRHIMLVAQTFMLLVSALLVAVTAGGLLTPWLLLGFTFLIGAGGALHHPAWHATIGTLVPRDDLGRAVAVNAMGMNATRAVGPATGGMIVAAAGAAWAFAINAVSYLALIAALWVWKPEEPARKLPREQFGRALVAGLRYFLMSPRLQNPALRSAMFGFGGIGVQALLPLVARDLLGGNAVTFGVLLGCFGAGAVAAAFLTDWLRSRWSGETLCRLGFLAVALCAVIISQSGFVPLTAAATFAAGMAWLTVLPMLNVNVQISTPRWVLGRVLSIYMMGMFGGMAVGAWIWGLVTEGFGLPLALILSAAVLALGAAWGLVHPLPDLERGDLGPANRFTEPQLGLSITPFSGPILIMVEYRVHDEDLPQFADLMQQRRRVRVRNGARRWSLLRDLEEPDVWVESFHFPTWLEYIRHHERGTQADVELSDRLIALHRGGGRLRVHRMIEREAISPNGEPPRRRPDLPVDPGGMS